ncbi:2-C-methyl-D-erythritol 4-phosphate cytidylyltransferase [Streptomyces sp. NPDC048507]|uniref:IspD/TarI family cytidylyltransferase n=1 Tax=Streptomyces sp. NPDC048507 TaxID=3365560 RepID=UPI003712B544
MAHHQHLREVERPRHVGAVILAAGHGERIGAGPKALLEVGGKPLLLHVLESMGSNSSIESVVVTAPPSLVADFRNLVASTDREVTVRVTPGGPTRQHSARLGVEALPPEADWVAITDVARPFTPPGAVDALLDELRGTPGSAGSSRPPCGIVPSLPLVDSLHLLDEDPFLGAPFDRALLRAAQTPQIFDRNCVSEAHAAAARDRLAFTDDAGMIRHFGGTVTAGSGDASNFKITYERDLALAEALYAHLSSAPPSGSSAHG